MRRGMADVRGHLQSDPANPVGPSAERPAAKPLVPLDRKAHTGPLGVQAVVLMLGAVRDLQQGVGVGTRRPIIVDVDAIALRPITQVVN